jgi:thiol-disulfide isomerase/thioredoxin
MKFLIIACFFSALLHYGCKNDEGKAELKDDKKYSVEIIDEKQLSEIISNRGGRALFVNVWATWCAPCVEEFPDIVKTVNYYDSGDIDFISLNVDMSSQVDSLVIPFLKAFKAEDFKTYNIREKSAEAVINLLNPEWNGAIPATFIYDRKGNQRVFILGADKFSTFVSAIDSIRNLH